MSIIKEYKCCILTDDENKNNIHINLELKKFDNLEWCVDIYDSKERHFFLKTKDNTNNKYTFDFEHYYNKAITNQLDITYDLFENILCIYLDGGGFCDQANYLEEIFDFKDNLSMLKEKIIRFENKINELNEIKNKIKNQYPQNDTVISQDNFTR